MFTACLLTLLLAQPFIDATGDATRATSPPTAPSAYALATGPSGCFVQVGDRVLMVRDIWSRRWGLPGGGHDAGETARQTAQRETFEETGLRVLAGEKLWTTASNFSVYRCAPDGAGITAHDNFALVLPKAGYDELIEARLVRPSEIADRQLRYPSQRTALEAALRASPGLPASVLRPPLGWSRWFTDELPVISRLQSGVAQVFGADADAVMRACSQLGASAGILLVLVAVWFLVGWRAGTELAYALLIACLLGVIAKQIFAWPRPFHVVPALQHDAAGSFGFPSGHTLAAAVLWGLVAQRVRLRGRWLACGALVAACAVSRVALGVHFIHDVVAGGALGAALCWAYRAYGAAQGRTQVALGTWRLAAGALGPLALVVHPQPSTVSLCALLIGFTLGSWGMQARRHLASHTLATWHWRMQPSWGVRLCQGGAALLLAAGILLGAPRLLPVESSFVPQLVLHVCMYTALGGLLAVVSLAADILQPPRACASHVT